jgi:hypothetical protein
MKIVETKQEEIQPAAQNSIISRLAISIFLLNIASNINSRGFYEREMQHV